MDLLDSLKTSVGAGWAGVNEPTSLEVLSGIWVVDAYAWFWTGTSTALEKWGKLRYREWGMVLDGPGLHLEGARQGRRQ